MSNADVLFRYLHADELHEVIKIESLCSNCFEDGITVLLLTKIPFFRDVIIASFSCDHCGFHNNSIDSAGKCQNKGVKLVLKVLNKVDLNRRVVMSKTSILSLPELDSSFPISGGAITTVEGAIAQVIENINKLQDKRRELRPELAEKLEDFVKKLEKLMDVDEEYILELTDPSGNSVIENLLSPKRDPQLTIEYYSRSAEENESLGLFKENEDDPSILNTFVDEAHEEFKATDEVIIVNDNCYNCNGPIQCKMKVLDIPHFKEVIIMASSCDSCGNKENKIVGGCGIAEKGQCLTLRINEAIDLARDFLKTETASVHIPEFDIETKEASLGGRFTTVEGILRSVVAELTVMNPFLLGDSSTTSVSEAKLRDLIEKIRQVADGEVFGVTLIVKDPAGNSYIQDLYSPEVDPRLTAESYERSDEDNEYLGINDMVTEAVIR